MRIADGRSLRVFLFVSFLNEQAHGERTIIHAHAILVQCPTAQVQTHGQVKFHLVAVSPFALDAQQAASHLAIHRLPIDGHVGSLGPCGDAQVKGKLHRSLFLDASQRQRNVLVERIMRLFVQNHTLAVGHLQRGPAVAIDKQGCPTVSTGQHKILGIIGPPHSVVVLAASAAEGIHHEERPAIVDAGMMVAAIGLHHVGTSNIAQRSHVFRVGGRQTIEGDILQVLHPQQVAGLRHQYLVGKHLLHEPACLRTLSRVDVAMPTILICSEHAARHLSIDAADEMKVVVSCLQGLRIAADQIVFRRLAEAFCHVHVVPVGQGTLLHPVGGATVNLFC